MSTGPKIDKDSYDLNISLIMLFSTPIFFQKYICYKNNTCRGRVVQRMILNRQGVDSTPLEAVRRTSISFVELFSGSFHSIV